MSIKYEISPLKSRWIFYNNITMRVTQFVAEQRDANRFIYGLPKHLPYYCRVVMAVLKCYKIYDARKIIQI